MPMLVSSLGLIDDKSPLYEWAKTYGLPASLFLLLLEVDVKAIARLGRAALLIFFSGSFGIILGTVAAFAVFRPLVGDEFWSGFGALSASWTGGSANMVAVKEAAGTPDGVFLPMVVVDTLVPYLWMGVLVAGSSWQNALDRWMRADPRVMEDIRQRIAGLGNKQPVVLSWHGVAGLVVFAFTVSLGLQAASQRLPVVNGVISTFTWTIILASAAGLAGSMTALRRLDAAGSTKIGYYLLYFVLTTIGAKASVAHVGASAVLVGAGVMIVGIHAAVLLIAGRMLRVPAMLVATASQANIGGVASAPVVAEIYQPGLAAVGLLMAVLGNIVGTYLGIVTGQICRWITGAF